MKKNLTIGFWILLTLAPVGLQAQQILIDRGIRIADLWVFPLFSDTSTYLYLPYQGELVKDEAGVPKFSMLRYIINKPSENDSEATITEADGGAIVHFLFEYNTPQERISQAQAALRERMENDSLSIRGPVVFESGRYTLISSILKEEGETAETEILSVGEAPVLEGSRIALTFDLSPQKSKLLMESLRQNTSDLSVVFDLSFSGLSDSYQAKLEVDWTKVRTSQAFKAGGSIYFVGADVELGFDRLRQDNAITLTTVGEHATMEGLLNTVYDKLLKLLFDPVAPETVPEGAQGGMMDAFSQILGTNGLLGSRNTTGFGLSVGYKMKDYKTEGTSVLNFNGRSTVDRHHYITFNAGNLYTQYGDNPDVFADVPLYDPAFQQREIFIGIDGDLQNEFEDMLNSVTVSLRKVHQGGQETLRQMVLTRNSFSEYEGSFSMVYGSMKDTNRVEWLNYDYQALWQFQGGGSLDHGWKQGNASMINLYTPFERRLIELEGDMDLLKEKDVRAIILLVEYPFFDQVKKKRVTIRPGDDLTKKAFEVTLPVEQEDVEYSLTWIKGNGEKLSLEGKDSYGLIFIDELPES